MGIKESIIILQSNRKTTFTFSYFLFENKKR